jgi:hypothetical protein
MPVWWASTQSVPYSYKITREIIIPYYLRSLPITLQPSLLWKSHLSAGVLKISALVKPVFAGFVFFPIRGLNDVFVIELESPNR